MRSRYEISMKLTNIQVRPGTESPVYVTCSKCGQAVLVSIGDTEARCSNCQSWVRR
jgi:hypothetical protein